MAAARPYGGASFLDRLKMVFSILPLPVVMIYRLIISPFTKRDSYKSWRRVLADVSFRFSSSALAPIQIQSLLGTDRDVYRKWAARHRVAENVEPLGDPRASLMWLAPRPAALEKVILYLHGGCYCLPMQDFAADYWKKHVDAHNAASGGAAVGLVALQYSLVPTAPFPAPLHQAVLAVQHFLDQGVRPENIHLAGESAGGGLVLQVLSHLLHPLPGRAVPALALPPGARFGSMCIMSPIAKLDTAAGSYAENSDLDVLPEHSWAEFYEFVGAFVKPEESGVPYVEAARAPERWFADADKVVRRVWLSTGEYECLRDDNLAVMEMFSSADAKFLTTYIEPKGVHVCHYLDLMAGEAGPLAHKIIQWVEEGL